MNDDDNNGLNGLNSQTYHPLYDYLSYGYSQLESDKVKIC
jgi:hypothetical protein